MDKKTSVLSIAIIGFMFFIFGFVSWVNSILIPYFKLSLDLSNFRSYLVAFAFYIAYLVMSVPSSLLLEKLGFKKGMMLGFFMMALGAFLFVPAALTQTYGVFLLGLFSIGTGLAILQTAANPYITIIGPIERAAQRISIMGICNKFAGIVSPLVFAAVIFKIGDNQVMNAINEGTLNGAEKAAALHELLKRVITPYTVLGVLLFLVGLLIYFSPLPEINTSEANKEETAEGGKRKDLHLAVSPSDPGCTCHFLSCRLPDHRHRYHHRLCPIYGNDLAGSKNFPFLYPFCGVAWIFGRNRRYSPVHQPAKCPAHGYHCGLYSFSGCLAYYQ
ncbi:MAG: MFS transporter [Mangrovibacterium sp.]